MSSEHVFQLDEDSLRAREGAEGFQRLLDDLNRGFFVQQILGEAEMRRERCEIESVPLIMNEMNAHPTAAIPIASWHYWGQRLGYQCWDDPEFVREFKRDNPDCVIRPKMAHASIVNPFGQPLKEAAAA